MSRFALILAYLLLASAAIAQTLPLANEELLHSARAWEARDRGDMARLALEKLVAARPDLPGALVELGELHLRMADIPAAQSVLQRLEARFASSPEAREFAVTLRFATRDRLLLASVQRLVQIGRDAEARTQLATLFPDGPPGGSLGIEYFRLLASTPGGWERSLEGLRRLVAQHPGDARYQIALGRHLLRQDATQIEGVQMLSALARRDDVRLRDVDEPLGSAIRELGYRRVPSDVLRAYAGRHANDKEISELLAQRLRIEREQELVLREARNAVDPQLQRRNLEELLEALLATQAATRSADHAVALLRRLRGASDERELRFDAATEAALRWAQRSRMSAARSMGLASVEKDIAVAFARTQHERVIELAPRLEAHTDAADVDDLLAQASRLDANSSWLFETRVRRLLAAGRADDALRLLDARAVDARWTAAARDELRANALDQRAQTALASGKTAEARTDLERAVGIAPTYPWTRFRLAGLMARGDERDAAVALMREGAQQAPDDAEMRYAQALFLASIDDATGALEALSHIPSAAHTDGMRALDRRLRIDRASLEAQRLAASADTAAARAILIAVEPLTRDDIEATRQVANAWIDIGDSQHGLALFEPFLQGARASDTDVQLAWSDALNRAADDRLPQALALLRSNPSLTSTERQRVVDLEREHELRAVRSLQRDGSHAGAIERVETMLARTPDDRTLRILRAELEMSAGRPLAARDRLAALVAEQPGDLDTRLSYARALTATGDVDLARLQVQTVAEQAPADDIELQLSLARRQLDLGDSGGASRTLSALLATDPSRSDALMLAGRAELAQRDFVRAREFFTQAERSRDLGVGSQARLAREAIETRMQSWMEAGIEARHKPGDSGISQFDSRLIPTLWRYARDYEHRLTLLADAVSIDAGRLPSDYDIAALLGTVQAFGPITERRYRNEREDGLSLGLRYETDTLSADIGTTPLGFLLTNVVGGIEWAPEWGEIDLAFGLGRRAVTSSVLSYAGMRDPITGREWGGIIETGPYAEAGLYRENYSIAGAVRYTRLTGENVEDNTFAGVRAAADWKFWSGPQMRAFVGVTANVWSYERNLQNYTFGHGGYYSPETYVSVALPLELQGAWRDWSFRVRASLSYSTSDIARTAFYPNDAALQAAALSSPLPSGYDAPFYEEDSGGGTSLSAYAAAEKHISRKLVLGAKIDIDRADYYEPTIFMLYVRHVFGSAATPLAIPPRPVRAYNE